MQKRMYVYLLANRTNRVIYTGVTSDLKLRLAQHRSGSARGFTSRYHVTKLVYFEMFDDSVLAIAREKQLKAGSRQRKIDLIERNNPDWSDLLDSL